ncbi:hypothetical protein BDV93DRAFT_480404 [Ceratobasidium sp. AG-I]|nr:hypothetical protein BDV93DRAFT_480404 [Ceratobasidium sp. AG-I]
MCICDSPAARKISGTAGVTGTYFCTRCWCHKDELHNIDKVHDRRTVAEHRAAAVKYSTLTTNNLRAEFLKKKATPSAPGGYRASCLLQLPYWDGARMIVVDPMHCLFLGIVKWQIKDIWLEFKHLREGDGLELSVLHNIIDSAQLPDFLGRPPPKTGTKEGGSLTADQFRTLASVIFPIAIPVIWGEIDANSAEQRSMEEYRRRRVEYTEALAARAALKRSLGGKAPAGILPPLPEPPRMPRRSRKRNQFDNQGSSSTNARNSTHDTVLYIDDEPDLRVHTSFRKDDDASILDLSLALIYLTGRTISFKQRQSGEFHLQRYLRTLASARGIENMAPNHHASTHIAEQTDDFGPVPQMWAYGSERLNRVLKNANTNHHVGGEMEEAFTNAHMRRQGVATKMQSIAHDQSHRLHGWAQFSTQTTSAKFTKLWKHSWSFQSCQSEKSYSQSTLGVASS